MPNPKQEKKDRLMMTIKRMPDSNVVVKKEERVRSKAAQKEMDRRILAKKSSAKAAAKELKRRVDAKNSPVRNSQTY